MPDLQKLCVSLCSNAAPRDGLACHIKRGGAVSGTDVAHLFSLSPKVGQRNSNYRGVSILDFGDGSPGWVRTTLSEGRPRFAWVSPGILRRLPDHWTNACRDCALKASCTTGKERRITRWEHEHVLEEVQRRLDNNPQAMRQRRETVEHPFGTMKARMGATRFLTKTLPKVDAEMALSVLAYNLTRVMNIVGTKPLMAAIAA
jgi:hypothetical protein